jgi:hypothetical protein
MRRHGDAHESAAAVLDDHEHVEQSECRRDATKKSQATITPGD